MPTHDDNIHSPANQTTRESTNEIHPLPRTHPQGISTLSLHKYTAAAAAATAAPAKLGI
jgi:hypothetical protein